MKAKITGIICLCALLVTSCINGTVFANPTYEQAKQAVQDGKAAAKGKQKQVATTTQQTKTLTPEEAAKEAERQRRDVATKSEKPEVYVARGMVFDGMKEYRNAIANYDFAIYLNPKLWQAYYQRALDRHILHEYEAALSDLDKVLELKPQNLDAYYQRGLVLSSMGDYLNAIAAFEKAANSVVLKGKAESGMGVANYYLKQYAVAKKNFDAAVALDPADSSNYVWLGRLQTEAKDYKGALELYNKALTVNPADSEAYLFKGRTLAFFLKNYDEGILAFTKAIETNPDYADAYLQRAYAYNQKGNGKMAKDDFDKAVALNASLKDQVLPAYRGDGKQIPQTKPDEKKRIVVTAD